MHVALLLCAAALLGFQDGQDPKEKGDTKTVAVRKILRGLGKHLGTVARERISMIWVVDRSPSMSDDRARVSKELDTIFASLPQGKTLKMGVIAYDEKATVVAPVTSKIDRVKEALLKVGPVGGGTENVSAAILKALSLTSDGRVQRVLLILTDEMGDDAAKLDSLIPRIRKSGVRVYVFGRESVFGWSQAYERDETAKITVPVKAGPESAGTEMLQINPLCCAQKWEMWCRKMLIRPELQRAMNFFNRTNPLRCNLGFDQSVPAGWGFYGLERLCRETGGAYYLLRDRESYKPQNLVGYEPEWVPVREWRGRNAKDKMRRTVVVVLEAIRNEGSFNLLCKFSGAGEGKTISRRVPRVEQQFAAWIAALQKAAKKAVATGDAKPYRRWEANRDLLEAQLWAMLHYLEQYRLTLADEPYPKDAPQGVWIASDPKVRGDGKMKAKAQEKLKLVTTEHPGTPWAKTAARLSKNLLGFKIVAARYGRGTPKSAGR